MTECNTSFELFHPGKKKVVVDFSGGDLSSDGGIALLGELEKKHGFVERFSSCISDPRDPSRIIHSQESLIQQRVFQICAGHEDANDSQVLRHDPILKIACGKLPVTDGALGSQPTITRLENRVTGNDLKRVRNFFINEFIVSLGKEPEEIILDIDGYADETHGNQQLSFFHGFYDHHMYHPVFITHAPSGFPLLLQLRAGNSHAGKGVKAILRWIFWRLRTAFPKARIILRGDGGFSLPEIMNVCERQGIEYVLGYSRNPVLERKNAFLLESARVQFCRTGVKARLFDDVFYMAGSWKAPRKIIMKAEVMEQGGNQRFLVTNMDGDAQSIYDDVYVMRAEHSENRIKELKIDLKADRLSCTDFNANQYRLLLHQLSYLFLLTVRSYAATTELCKARFSTIQKTLIKIAVRVKETSRRVFCQFSSCCPYQNLFRKIFANINYAT